MPSEQLPRSEVVQYFIQITKQEKMNIKYGYMDL